MIKSNSESEAFLASFDIGVQINGNNKVIAKDGVFSFENIKIIAKPDYNSSISIYTNAIDINKYKKITGKDI